MKHDLVWKVLKSDGHQLIWSEGADDGCCNRQLTPDERQLLLDTAVQGDSVQDVAAQLGLVDVTVIHSRAVRRQRRRRRDPNWKITVIL